MRVETARTVARAPRLSWKTQRALWAIGDHITRAGVARQEDLEPEIADQVIDSYDDALYASWASVPRSLESLDIVTERAVNEHALIALAGQPRLSGTALDSLASRATPVLASKLLSRSDISETTRAQLASVHVKSQATAKGYVPRMLGEVLGDSPLVWAEAIRAALPDNPGLIAWPSMPDDPLVQDALIEVLESLTLGAPTARTLKDIERGMLELVASPSLPPEKVERIRVAARQVIPSVAAQAAARQGADVPALLRQATCPPAGRRIRTDRLHIDSVSELLSLSGCVRLPKVVAASEALAHRDALPASLVELALAELRGESARELLAVIEYEAGSHCPELPIAIRHVNLWSASSLMNPIPAIKTLAESGWEPLLLPSNIPQGAAPVVAVNFAPVHRVLSEPSYATVILAEVDALPLAQADVVWALLDEWEGNFVSLLRSSRTLSCDP